MVAAVPRKRSGNRRCVSWSKGTGCGGAASLSFGERTGSNGCSAGRWLLPLPGNGPGAGGVLLCRREQAAAGRRASLSGRGRLGQKFPRGSGCCRSSETVREQAVCFLVEGDGLRRGGEPLFRGEAGSDASPIASAIRLRYSPPLFASAVRCYHPPPATTRRLPPLAACHHSPPAITRRPLPPPPLLVTPVAVCLPAAVAFPPACHYPPPATSAADCVLTACVSTVCRFSPLVITTCRPPLPPAACLLPPSSACHHPLLPAPPPLPPAAPAASHPAACVPAACYLRHRCLPPLSLSASPLPVAFPRLLSPAACRPLPPPLSASPLLPAVPPLLTSRTRCLPFPPPCAGRADRWAAAAPRVVGRGAMRRRREVLRNNLENRKILPIFVSVKYRGSGLSRPGFLFFIGLSFLWQKRLSI